MQKNGKKLLAWMLAASMVFSFSMPTQAAKKKPALSKKKAVITVGKTLTLKVKNISKILVRASKFLKRDLFLLFILSPLK